MRKYKTSVMRNFKQLMIWQKGIQIAIKSIKVVSTFPKEEKYGMSSQIARAAVSISSNIAEGSSRMSQADFARFIEIATGSVFELTSQAFVAKKQGLLPDEHFHAIYQGAEELSRMLSGLRKSLSPV